MRYLIVLTAAGRRLSATTFATESAFVDHVRSMKKLAPRFDEFVLAMAEMQEQDYEQQKSGLSVVDEAAEHIRFEPVFTAKLSRIGSALELPAALRKLERLVDEADLVHTHPTYDLYRPFENIASAFALAKKKKLIAVTDMDNRKDAEMNYKLGRWSAKSYYVCKLVYDPIRDLQQRLFVKLSDLVLFKEPQQVEEYGKGAPHVRLFLDPNFQPSQIAGDDVVQRKVAALDDARAPLRVLYFGRYVPYKGVDRMIDAVARARALGANLTLDLMGTGAEEPHLRALVRERGIADIVTWLEPRPYGERFFEVLRERHVLLACPLSADTPRSTWDALASAMTVLAFDTPFYAGIARYTGAVDVVPWPDVEPLAQRLVELARDKRILGPMMTKAVAAARTNTGDDWLKRRVAWVEELFTNGAT